MKKYLLIILPAFIAVLQSCEPDQSNTYVAGETCSDGILNQGENEIDCGGPCPACNSRMTAVVNGASWTAQGNISSSTNNGSIIILSGNGTSTMSMIYTGPFSAGTFNLNSAIYCDLGNQINYLSNGGTITFTDWDTHHKVVSGTFSFTGKNMADTTDTRVVTQGVFKYVPYP